MVKSIFSWGLMHIVLGREVNVNGSVPRKVHHWEGEELLTTTEVKLVFRQGLSDSA